jgi:hypothetical protein
VLNEIQCSESSCALRLRYVDLVVSIEVAVEVCCCCVTFHRIQLLNSGWKCNTGTVFNCLIQFLLTMVLSIKERVFLVEYVFREGNKYTDLVHSDFPNALCNAWNSMGEYMHSSMQSLTSAPNATLRSRLSPGPQGVMSRSICLLLPGAEPGVSIPQPSHTYVDIRKFPNVIS